jgi:cell division inhibitor SepF
MAGFFNKAMDFLGLSDNDAYDDYPSYEDQGAAAQPFPRRGPAVSSSFPEPEPAPVRQLPVLPSDSGVSAVQAQPQQKNAVSGSVRPIASGSPASTKVQVVAPTSFAEAQEIGECFRSMQPVIVNLTGVDRDLKRRLVDFASGLTFGLNGDMKRVADSVFMLTPTNVEVSAEEKRRLQERGLYRS